MAEVTEAADPSMEEILASIRKIISDENPPAEAVAEPATSTEDVLELTKIVEDDGSVTDLAAVAPQPAPPPPPPVMEEVPPAPPLPPVAVAPEDPLVSEPAVSSSASALSSLVNTVEIGRLSAGPNGTTLLGNGGRTLEDMVLELMRPMLKEWLDSNLPQTVERLVQKEIERISRRS